MLRRKLLSVISASMGSLLIDLPSHAKSLERSELLDDAINIAEMLTRAEYDDVSGGVASIDMTDRIQSAINKGNSVFFGDDPTWIYAVRKLILHSGSKLFGEASLRKIAGHNDCVLYAINEIEISIQINIDGNNSEQNQSHSDIFLENCKFVLLDNATVRNGYGTSLSVFGSVTLVNCDEAYIGNNFSVLSAKYDGLFIINGSEQNVVGGNYNDCGYSGLATYGAIGTILVGVKAQNNGTSNITLNGPANKAFGCIGIGSKKFHGINIGHNNVANIADECEIYGGVFSNNGMFGISVLGGNNHTQRDIKIRDSKITSNKLDGVKITGAIDCVIINVISNINFNDGFRIEGENTFISNCFGVGNGRYGLYINRNVKNFGLSYNVFQDNKKGDIF